MGGAVSNGATPENPRVEAPEAPSTPSEPTPDDASQVTTASQEDEPKAGSSEFERRVREDPEFAWEQVRKHQSRADQVSSRALPEWVTEQVGGPEAVVKILQTLGSFVGDPNGKKVWERFQQTGKLGDDFDTGFDSEDEPDPRDVELKQMKEQLRETQATQLQSQMQGHFRKTYEAFDFTTEEREKIEKGVLEQMKQWSATDAGVSALKSIAQSEKSARNLILNQLSNEEILEAARRADLRKQERRGALSTDSPPQVSTTGREKPSQEGQSVLDKAVAAFKEASQEIGHDWRQGLRGL